MGKYKTHLQNAINNYEDEISRENEMTLFFPIIYEYDYVSPLASNLRDIFTMIKVAVFSKNNEPYTREQIMALVMVIDFIKENINMPDNKKDNAIDILDSQFDLSGPLIGIETLE